MADRRGMWIKNVSLKPVHIVMESRTLTLKSGDVFLLSSEEVRDPVLREHLQIRSVAIVRPATEVEETKRRKKGAGAVVFVPAHIPDPEEDPDMEVDFDVEDREEED